MDEVRVQVQVHEEEDPDKELKPLFFSLYNTILVLVEPRRHSLVPPP